MLATFDPARPVFTEAESRRIGLVSLPNELIERMRAAPCLRIDASVAARTDFLLRDCTNVCSWFRARGLEVDEHALFGDLLVPAF